MLWLEFNGNRSLALAQWQPTCLIIPSRVTILGEISKFGLLFKAQALVCSRCFKSFQVQGISCTYFGLLKWALMTFFGNCFGYFFQNLGDFFPFFWSPWSQGLGFEHRAILLEATSNQNLCAYWTSIFVLMSLLSTSLWLDN